IRKVTKTRSCSHRTQPLKNWFILHIIIHGRNKPYHWPIELQLRNNWLQSLETDLNYYNFTLIGTGISSLSTGRSPADEFYGSSRNPKGKNRILVAVKK
ncbi:hypothetical protein, partial [uncultured Bacteroides sp.]|uniref:hypothetical protein n=1 Tax=uncultured Bacteroides sp. TaxID=162156 RepID=UPI00280A94C2